MASISTGPWSAGVVDAAGLFGAATFFGGERLADSLWRRGPVVARQSIAGLGYRSAFRCLGQTDFRKYTKESQQRDYPHLLLTENLARRA